MKKFNCILVVDDDPVSCFINMKILNMIQITNHSHVASNGAEAMDFIKDHCDIPRESERCPDLIFLDLNMPIMDGFEFLEAFRHLHFEKKEEVEIVVLTSSTNTMDREKVSGFNVMAYLNKPLTPESLQGLFGNGKA